MRLRTFEKACQQMDELRARNSSDDIPDYPPLVLGFNTINVIDELNVPNGWSTDKKWLDNLFAQYVRRGNAYTVWRTKTYSRLVDIFKDWPNITLLSWMFDSAYINNQHIECMKLEDIPTDTNYIYPIRIYGRGQVLLEVDVGGTVYIPEKVKKDCQAGKCKILFNEVFEGHGDNLFVYKTMFLKVIADNGLQPKHIGFIDGNILTTVEQATYGTKGFYCMHFETTSAAYDIVHSDEHNSSRFGADVHPYDNITRDMITLRYYHRPRNQPDINVSEDLRERTTLQEHVIKGPLYLQDRTVQLDILENQKKKPYRFINLNRRTREHRTIITSEIFNNHSHNTLWSYTEPRPDTSAMNLNVDFWEPLPTPEYVDSLPKIIDVDSDVNDIQVCDELQSQAYINIVSETTFYRNNIFLSEKIFKPIIHGQPFVVVGSPGSLRLLRAHGYKTFSPYICEDYDNEPDDNKRMQRVINELRRLSDLPEDTFLDQIQLMYEICVHNMQNFINRFRKMSAYANSIAEITHWATSND